MHKLTRLLIALPLVMVVPASGQDFFGSFQDMVEQLVPSAKPAPKSGPKLPAAPETAPVPRPRPADLEPGPDDLTAAAPAVAEDDAAPLPRPRPEEGAEPEPVPEVAPVEPEPEAMENKAAEPAPQPAPAEPDRVYQTACPAVILGLVEAEALPPLSEAACGEQSPLKVTAVLSRGRMVPLSSPITTNCEMASALPDWVATVDGYADAMLDSPLAEVVTGTSYMCRNRNNASSGFTSEHGFANAVDVTGFTLEDGRSIDVTANWLPAAQPEGRLLRLAHDAACAGFTTTLGPEANAEHHDHLHLDLGCHGKTCTARICE